MLERDDRRPLGRDPWATHRPALRERAVDETLREEQVTLAHGRDADLCEELETGASRVDGGHGRSSIFEPACARSVREVLDVERERVHHAPPADGARPRALRDLATRVE